MKKKVISLTLVMIITIALIPATAFAAPGDYGADGDFIWYELDGGVVEVATYIGTDTVITVPDTLNSMPVVGIANSAFSSMAFTSVTVSDGVTYIGDGAFASCGSLASISLPSSVETIGVACFSNCISLGSITLPASLKTLGVAAFVGDPLLNTVVMGNDLTTMGESTFYNCTSLTNVTLSTSLGAIPQNAFYGCTNLTHITIPDSVEAIGQTAFAGTGLTGIDIPGSVKAIGYAAFNSLTSLTSITLHSGLETISGAAFVACSNLTQVTIPETVTSIASGAFANCSGLTGLTIRGAATALDDAAFAGCTSLNKATILIETGVISGHPFGGCPFADGIYGFAGTTTETYAGNYSIPFHTLYKVVYDSQGGSDVDFSYNVSGGTVDEPDDPTLDGYVFGGWFDNEECTGGAVTFPYTVTGDVTLYAKWTELTLSSSVASGEIYTGGRITLTPSVAGGTWSFNTSLLSRSGNEFTGLAAGTARVTYTVSGVSVNYDVTIRDSGLPGTGQDFTLFYIFGAAAAAFLAAGLTISLTKRRQRG
jgi:uncharacterized repeat protein (TIGR02543 family)